MPIEVSLRGVPTLAKAAVLSTEIRHAVFYT